MEERPKPNSMEPKEYYKTKQHHVSIVGKLIPMLYKSPSILTDI